MATHSTNYEKVKKYYDNFLEGVTPGWNKSRVHMAVECKWITKAEYKTITGETYKDKA